MKSESNLIDSLIFLGFYYVSLDLNYFKIIHINK